MTTPTLDPATWVSRFANELYRYAIQRLRSDADAEDVVQETFLTAWRTRDTYRGDLSERNWLYLILKSRIIDLVRRKQVQQRTFVESAEVGEDHFEENGHWKASVMTPWTHGSFDEIDKIEFQEVFDRCLGNLNERQRLAFLAREVEGQEADEICKELDITPSNLWVTLHRARLKLRDCLQKNWFGVGTQS